MFKISDYVCYGATGVCQITETKKERISGVTKEYYVLKPVFNENSAVYVPMDSPILVEKMKPVLSATEIKKLITNAKKRNDEWIVNDFQRSEQFKGILKSGDRANIIEIIRMIYRRQKELASRGKHLHVSDERTRRDAQTPICSEIAFVKGISPDEALELILANL